MLADTDEMPHDLYRGAPEHEGERSRRADRLTERLSARLRLHTSAQAEPSDGGMGPDPFGHRVPPPRPPFLADLDFDDLDATMVAPLLRRLSLARSTPRPQDVSLAALAADPGPVSSRKRSPEHRQWAPGQAPLLPQETVIPHLLHGIWLGGPIPEDAELRRTFAAAARRYAGQIDVVVWTDVSRAECEAVRKPVSPSPDATEPATRSSLLRSMLGWAEFHGIHLVCVSEIFHAGRPMSLYPQYVAEIDTQVPAGYAAARDYLRLEILARFGGAYVEGGSEVEQDGDGPALAGTTTAVVDTAVFDAVAGSRPGFTLRLCEGPLMRSDVIVAAASHPVLLLWRELNRLEYLVSQRDGYGGLERMALRYANAPAARRLRRDPGAMRSDRTHRALLGRLGFTPDDPELVRLDGALAPAAILCRTRSSTAATPMGSSEDEVLTCLEGLTAATIRRLISREGNLQLTAVAPVVAALPDPDAAWVAILQVLAEVIAAGAAPAVSSVTRFRWDDDGRPEYVGLPAQAEALLSYADPDRHWFGADLALPEQPVWLLDEAVVPAALAARPPVVKAAANGPARSPGADLTPGELRIERPGCAPDLPAGFVGIHLRGHRCTLWSGQYRVTPEDVAHRLATVGLLGRPVALRFIGGPEHGIEWFGERLERLLRQTVLVLDEVDGLSEARAGAAAGGALAARRLRHSIAAARTVRRQQAEWLLRELRTARSRQETDRSKWPVEAPTRIERLELLAWLRERVHPQLYRPEFEAETARRLGPDPFGLRRPRPVPDFLAEVELPGLEVALVAPLLRRLSLTRTAPVRADLSIDRLRTEPGTVTSMPRSPVQRRWGQLNGPWLPATAQIPHLVHAVWLGGPLPVNGSFRANFGAGARRYAGEMDFIVWTDVSRAEAVAARRPVPVGAVDRWAAVRSMLDWAQECGAHLVNVFEVFNSGCPMALQGPFEVEMSTMLPQGFAAASDHLRVDVMALLGGAYVDGDNVFDGEDVVSGRALRQSLPELFAVVAQSWPGFTLHPVRGLGIANDVIVAPAAHPALALWMEIVRVGYRQTERELFAGLGRMTRHYARHRNELDRYPVVWRSGRRHHQALQLLRIHGPGQSSTRPCLIEVDQAIGFGSDLSWAASSEVVRTEGQAEVQVVQQIVTTLARQLITREGNLHLTLVAPVVAGLSNPDAAWIAVLTQMGELSRDGIVPAVTSITEVHEKQCGQYDSVQLPDEAEAFLDRTERDISMESEAESESEPGWFGSEMVAAGRSAWLLDEKVTAIRLRATAVPPVQDLRSRSRVVHDASGLPRGVWLATNARNRCGPAQFVLPTGFDRALALPPEVVAVWAEARDGDAVAADSRVWPEELAVLLIELGFTDRPVLLIAFKDDGVGLAPFARRLRAVVDQPVLAVRSGMLQTDQRNPGDLGLRTVSRLGSSSTAGSSSEMCRGSG